MPKVSEVPFEVMMTGDKVYYPRFDLVGYIDQLQIEEKYGKLVYIIWNNNAQTLFAKHELLYEIDYVGTNPRMS